MSRATLTAALLLATTASLGCGILGDISDGIDAPTADFDGVEIVHNPSLSQTLAWACYEYVGSSVTCGIAGYDSQPADSDMVFTFDLVFLMTNPNSDLPIPLVEILLGISVFEDDNLGAVCISFCDPDEEVCEIERDADEACQVDNVSQVDGFEDLVPDVNDLVDLVEDVADGEINNQEFRVIDPGTTLESHITFELDVHTMMGLFRTLLEEAVSDVLSGSSPELTVPYTVMGTLFFEVPTLDRYAINFGPVEGEWDL